MRTLWSVIVNDPAALMATARRYGFDSVAVKSADGNNPWSQFKDCVPAAREAGIGIFAWAYMRPTDSTEAFIEASVGADRLIIDAEIEWEQANTAATASAMADELLKAYPAVDLTSFAFPSLHPQFPYLAFMEKLNAFWPQVYFSDFGMSPVIAVKNALDAARPFKKPVIPIGQIYPNAVPAEIKQFTQTVGTGPIAFYCLDQAPPGNLVAAAGPVGLYRGLKGPQVQAMSEFLFQAGYAPNATDFNLQTENAVKQFQVEHGLTPDGIMTPADQEKLKQAVARVKQSSIVQDLQNEVNDKRAKFAKIKPLADAISSTLK